MDHKDSRSTFPEYCITSTQKIDHVGKIYQPFYIIFLCQTCAVDWAYERVAQNFLPLSKTQAAIITFLKWVEGEKINGETVNFFLLWGKLLKEKMDTLCKHLTKPYLHKHKGRRRCCLRKKVFIRWRRNDIFYVTYFEIDSDRTSYKAH